MDDKLLELIERLAKNEAAINEQTRVFAECIQRNNAEHEAIMHAVDEGKKWRLRVQWITGTVLIMTGMIIGYILNHIDWFWNILPMHRHTH